MHYFYHGGAGRQCIQFIQMLNYRHVCPKIYYQYITSWANQFRSIAVLFVDECCNFFMAHIKQQAKQLIKNHYQSHMILWVLHFQCIVRWQAINSWLSINY